ncbi:hypothetical protein X274_00745 [Marinitoga sp. 1155]|nr:hypothetical protein X274_00745 [Marinitoga sp. 1155]
MLKGYYLVNKSQDPILACEFCQCVKKYTN